MVKALPTLLVAEHYCFMLVNGNNGDSLNFSAFLTGIFNSLKVFTHAWKTHCDNFCGSVSLCLQSPDCQSISLEIHSIYLLVWQGRNSLLLIAACFNTTILIVHMLVIVHLQKKKCSCRKKVVRPMHGKLHWPCTLALIVILIWYNITKGQHMKPLIGA